jgi:hypothetical protein
VVWPAQPRSALDLAVAVGPGARGYLDGATGRTLPLVSRPRTGDRPAAPPLVRSGDLVLLKNSRTAGLERLAEALAR